MAVFYRCKMCGGELTIVPDSNVCTCEYCGTRQTVPSADNEKKMTLFTRASRILRDCEFDKAAGVFESIVADFPNEAEAYWGLVLCKYGIEYVDDPATGKKVPTCHRSSFESVMDDTNYQQAIENADTVAKEVYISEGAQIEELRRGIIAVSNREDPYDIFICYKETDENGERTEDSVLAQDAYDALTEKGYRVFFSRVSLEDKLGAEFEPYIFAALNSAKLMLVFGTKPEHYEAVWVKNEWSRFLQLMEEKDNKHLIPCYRDMEIDDFPQEFARLQAQNMDEVGAMQELLRGVDKLLQQPNRTVKSEQKRKKKVTSLALIAVVLLVAVVCVRLKGTSGQDTTARESVPEITLAPIDPASGWNETGEIINLPLEYDLSCHRYGPTYATCAELFNNPNAIYSCDGFDDMGDQINDYLWNSYSFQYLETNDSFMGHDGKWKDYEFDSTNIFITIWENRWWNANMGVDFFPPSWHIVGYGLGKAQYDGENYYLPIHCCDAEIWVDGSGITEAFRRQ